MRAEIRVTHISEYRGVYRVSPSAAYPRALMYHRPLWYVYTSIAQSFSIVSHVLSQFHQMPPNLVQVAVRASSSTQSLNPDH